MVLAGRASGCHALQEHADSVPAHRTAYRLPSVVRTTTSWLSSAPAPRQDVAAAGPTMPPQPGDSAQVPVHEPVPRLSVPMKPWWLRQRPAPRTA